jgi:hypothetical protein
MFFGEVVAPLCMLVRGFPVMMGGSFMVGRGVEVVLDRRMAC